MNDEDFDNMLDALTKATLLVLSLVVLVLGVHFLIGFLTYISIGG